MSAFAKRTLCPDVLDKVVPKKPKDVVLVHSPTPDGGGVNVLRARRQGLEVGTMRPLAEGRPIHGEVVKLTQRPETPLLYDVETELPHPEPSAEPNGESVTEPNEARASSGPRREPWPVRQK